VLRPDLGLNATLARAAALPGSLGLVSQSAAVCAAMLDWARPNKVGFSSVVSLGGSTDIDFGEAIDFLVADNRTEQILLYVEGVRHARRFVSALRAAARAKPVVLMKVGRHPAGVRAAVSHTGTLMGLDEVFDAVVKRTGAVRVGTIGQLVAAAQALTSRVRPQGDRLAVVTNGGGPGVMAADRAADLGIPLAEFSLPTIEALKAALPQSWSHTNPVDLIGNAGADRYRAAVSACLADGNVDGVLAILAPQAMSEPSEAARAVIEAARGSSKPVLACWMGEERTAAGRKLFGDAAIPVFRTPDPAVEMFAHVSSFYRNQRALLQAPGPLSQQQAPDLAAARLVVDAAIAERRLVLSETESKALLAAFHIPVASGEIARPNGRELLAGVVRDPVFGPAITFGAGGAAAEVYGDRAVALPPLNSYLVADMIRGTRVAKLLERFRGQPPVDIGALEAVLLRVSELACELPALDELQINPLIADEAGVIALKARVVLRTASPSRERYGHMAIHPYPADLVTHWQPNRWPPVTLRPIRPRMRRSSRRLSRACRHKADSTAS
jgi:acetyltransferase